MKKDDFENSPSYVIQGGKSLAASQVLGSGAKAVFYFFLKVLGVLIILALITAAGTFGYFKYQAVSAKSEEQAKLAIAFNKQTYDNHLFFYREDDDSKNKIVEVRFNRNNKETYVKLKGDVGVYSGFNYTNLSGDADKERGEGEYSIKYHYTKKSGDLYMIEIDGYRYKRYLVDTKTYKERIKNVKPEDLKFYVDGYNEIALLTGMPLYK